MIGSARALLFDAALVALVVVLAVEAGAALRRLRQGEHTRALVAIGAVSLAGAIATVMIHAGSLVDLVSGDRWDVYPAQPRYALMAVFAAAVIGALAVVDSVMIRAGRLESHLGWAEGSALRRPGWLGVGVVVGGLIVSLVALDVVRLPSAGPLTATAVSSPEEVVSLVGLGSSVPASDLPGFEAFDPPDPLALTPVTGRGLLESPTAVASVPGMDVLYVAERAGRIRVIRSDGSVSAPFLDLTDRVSVAGDSGLLGLALHPGFAANGRLFVEFHSRTDTVVAEYVVHGAADDPTGAEPVTDLVSIPQLKDWHQGGRIDFGPDGFLYVAIGDGGDAGLAQDLDSLRGAILRLDVDRGTPYAVPAGNAFGGHEASEIWALGVRSPYQFWIDPSTGLMHIGDVGEGSSEEIDVVSISESGHNLGWPLFEGLGCRSSFDLTLEFGGCNRAGFVEPALTYGHIPDCAILLGPVYRGDAIPALTGWGVFADFCSHWIRAYEYRDGAVTDSRTWRARSGVTGLASYLGFGVDGRGEILVLTADRVYRLTPG